MWAAWPKRDGSDRKGHKTKAKAAFVRAAQSRGNDLTDLDQALRNYLAAVHNGNRPPKDCERFWQATEWPDWVDIEPGVVVRRTNGTNVQDHYEQRTRMLAEWARQKEQHHQHDQDEDLF